MKKIFLLLTLILGFSSYSEGENQNLNDVIKINKFTNNDRATATGNGVVAIGGGVNVNSGTGIGGVGIGHEVEIKSSTNSVSIGGFSKVLENSDASISIGANSTVDNASKSLSLGASTFTNAEGSIALGFESTASVKRSGTNALFSDEEIQENGVLSIGHKKDDKKPKIKAAFPIAFPPGIPLPELPEFPHASDLRRQIINVAGGVNDYDAVNISQLKAIVKALGFTDEEVKEIAKGTNGKKSLKLLIEEMKSSPNNVDNEEIKRIVNEENSKNNENILRETSGIANSVAMANLPVNMKNGIHSHSVSASYGNYGKNHAFSLGISGQGKGVLYKASMALNTSLKFSAGAGIGYTFFAKEDKSEIEKLKDEIKELREMIKEIKNNK